MRVAIYRVLYGEDYIVESIRSILPVIDRVVIALAPRPWGTSAGVRWHGDWREWPAKFDETRERVAAMREPRIEVIDDFYPEPKNQHQHIVNDLVLPRYPRTSEIVCVEPDHVFTDDERVRAIDEWNYCGGYRQATTRMVELWRAPSWRIAERHRASVIFHRLSGPMLETSGDGGQRGISSQWLKAQVHNLGFCMSRRTTLWKHLTAMAFSAEIGDAPPDPDWYEKKWLNWTPETRDLEISLGGQQTIPCAVPYDEMEAPASVRARFKELVDDVKVRKQEGGSYAIWCPACKCGHAFDKRWEFNGDLERPTFKGSLLVRGYLNEEHPDGICHSHVTDGNIIFCGDCTHALRGQTLPLEDF